MSEKRWYEYAPEITGIVDENYRAIESCESVCLAHGGFQITGFIKPEDSRLMAAAPELLEALEHCLRHIEPDERMHGRNFAAGNVARAAIKKARGEE